MSPLNNHNMQIQIPEGYEVREVHVFSGTEQEARAAYDSVINAQNEGYQGPITLPNGEQLRPLTNGEKWLLQKMLGVVIFLLLFSVIR